jgi:hypothetical protein
MSGILNLTVADTPRWILATEVFVRLEPDDEEDEEDEDGGDSKESDDDRDEGYSEYKSVKAVFRFAIQVVAGKLHASCSEAKPESLVDCVHQTVRVTPAMKRN